MRSDCWHEVIQADTNDCPEQQIKESQVSIKEFDDPVNISDPIAGKGGRGNS